MLQDTSLFGRIARLDPGVPGQDAVRLMVDTYEGRKPMASWRRPPGRPRNVLLNGVREDANALLLSMLWRSEIARGHGAMQWSSQGSWSDAMVQPGVMERCNGPARGHGVMQWSTRTTRRR